mmetsp:Transcript_23861/g.49922  ORF Transcript_23861/g.49922 Transcript_23861/m.49922 type:complete len:96 (+) Transcript_23861:52-339(+)
MRNGSAGLTTRNLGLTINEEMLMNYQGHPATSIYMQHTNVTWFRLTENIEWKLHGPQNPICRKHQPQFIKSIYLSFCFTKERCTAANPWSITHKA